ncbi:Cytotoxic domain protein [Rickettsiales bacterium Ac37b]|nr:Cytotoxic domain protein [Rickettsiales bacterium Ac37b]
MREISVTANKIHLVGAEIYGTEKLKVVGDVSSEDIAETRESSSYHFGFSFDPTKATGGSALTSVNFGVNNHHDNGVVHSGLGEAAKHEGTDKGGFTASFQWNTVLSEAATKIKDWFTSPKPANDHKPKVAPEWINPDEVVSGDEGSGEPNPKQTAGMKYIVQQGDNLSKIAEKYGVTVKELMDLNPEITDPNKIKIGQKVKLPENAKVKTFINKDKTLEHHKIENGGMLPNPNSQEAKTWENYLTKHTPIGDLTPQGQKAYNEIASKIDELNLSDAEKLKYQKAAYKLLVNMENSSTEDRFEIMQSLSNAANGKSKGSFGISDANAAVPAILGIPYLAELLGASVVVTMLSKYLEDHPITWKGFSGAAQYDGDVLEKSKHKDSSSIKLKTGGVDMGAPDPDFDPEDDNERKTNPTKAESKIWQELEPYKGKTRTNGLSGKERRYYEWDNLHNDIEVFDHKGKHLGSMNPKTGVMYKQPKGHKPSIKN